MARYGDLDSQYFDDSGNPVVNGKIYFYETGTTTLKNTYADINYTIANTNPVILTAAGRQPNIFFAGVAKAILTTNAGTQILVRDPVGVTTSAFGDPWVSSKTYGANEVVQGSNGQFYTSLVSSNLNNNPVTSTGSWTFLYSVEWSAGTTYTVGSVVTYQTIVYQSILSANTNQNPLTAPTYWVAIQMVWMATQTYALNANIVGTDGVLYTSLQTANINHIPASSPTWWAGTSAAAAASASAASTSASSAATSASTATTGASTATTQAGIATTQASSATSSASSATSSASSASTNAASTLALYNNYRSEYYGPLSTNPTLDPLGAAMTAGDLYWNTTSSEMRTYTGSAWVATYLPAAGYATAGANSNITSLSGLTTPLSVGQGGTSLTTLTANNVILGNGTSAPAFVAPGSSGNLLTSNGTSWVSQASAAPTVAAGAIIYTALNFGGF
jgi:hypothetical protein